MSFTSARLPEADQWRALLHAIHLICGKCLRRGIEDQLDSMVPRLPTGSPGAAEPCDYGVHALLFEEAFGQVAALPEHRVDGDRPFFVVQPLSRHRCRSAVSELRRR